LQYETEYITKTTFDRFQHYFEGRELDPDLNNYKDELLNNSQKLLPPDLPNQFLYVADLPAGNIVHVSDNFYRITGYDYMPPFPIKAIFDLIHPADRGIIIQASMEAIQGANFAMDFPPMSHMFSMDFRYKTAGGKYVRMLRHSGMLTKDKKNNMVHTISVMHDISFLKRQKKIELFLSGDEIKGYKFPSDELIAYMQHTFTKREMEILRLMADGKNSKEISEDLFISAFTVDTHRKRMLKRTKLNNSTELVVFAIDNNII